MLSLLAAGTAMAQNFTLKGTVPGVRKGTKVELLCAEGGRDSITAALSADGSFMLKGTVNGITLAELCILDRPESEMKKDVYPEVRGIKLMLEPDVDYTVEAPAFDKMPLSYDLYAETCRFEPNVKVSGGKAQSHYNEWRKFVFEASAAANESNFAWRQARFGMSRTGDRQPASEEVIKQKEAEADAAEAVLDSLNNVFMARHSDYAVSLYLKQRQIDEAFFRYTDSELNEMKALFSQNEDGPRYKTFCTDVESLRKYLKYASYTDFKVQLPDNALKQLSALMPAGTYTLIDFWASWCGPCRASIPHVRELSKQYAGKLNVLSVSVDKEEKAWRKAMGEEKMEWSQLWLPAGLVRPVKDTYQVTAIPYMLVISPQGRIIYAGHDPKEVSDVLTKEIN